MRGNAALMECKRLEMQTAGLQADVSHWSKHCLGAEITVWLLLCLPPTHQFQEAAVSRVDESLLIYSPGHSSVTVRGDDTLRVGSFLQMQLITGQTRLSINRGQISD